MRCKFVRLISLSVVINSIWLLSSSKVSAQNLELNSATLRAICTNGPSTYALYSLTLKPTFQGGLTGRTMISTLNQLKIRTDQGFLPFTRKTSGNTGEIAGNFQTYSVRGTATAIRTSPGLSIGFIPVPLFTVPCGDGPDGGGGGSTATGCISYDAYGYCNSYTLVVPSSVVSQGTIGLNGPNIPKANPFEAKEAEVQVGEWQGKSWQPEDQS